MNRIFGQISDVEANIVMLKKHMVSPTELPNWASVFTERKAL